MNKKHVFLLLVMSTHILLSGCSYIGKISDTGKEALAITSPTPSSKASSPKPDDIKDASPSPSVKPSEKVSSAADLLKNAQTTQKISKTSTITNINKEDLLTYSYMTKDSLIKKFGNQFTSDGVTLTFPNGLIFYGLVHNESKPSIIKFADSFAIMGIKNGMTFSEVQEILGKTNVIETYINTKDNKAYKIQYTIDTDILKVISKNKDGTDSYIIACPQ